MTNKKLKLWIEKVGAIGFLFFLAKGLLWLATTGAAALFFR